MPVGAAPRGANNIEMWSYESIYTNSPPLEIYVTPSPKEDVLSFGPVLPVVPWIPGIIQILSSRKTCEINDSQNISVHIIFSANYELDVSTVGHYVLAPTKAKLIIGENVFFPKNIECDPGRMGSQCEIKSDGRYSISVSTYNLAESRITLTFDVTGSGIKKAVLDVGNIVFDGNDVEIPKINIQCHSWIKTEAIP